MILYILIAYFVLMPVVFAGIDKDGKLLEEYKLVKTNLYGVWFMLFWPYVAYIHLRYEKTKKKYDLKTKKNGR